MLSEFAACFLNAAHVLQCAAFASMCQIDKGFLFACVFLSCSALSSLGHRRIQNKNDFEICT